MNKIMKSLTLWILLMLLLVPASPAYAHSGRKSRVATTVEPSKADTSATPDSASLAAKFNARAPA